jgi:hypothetical protein
MCVELNYCQNNKVCPVKQKGENKPNDETKVKNNIYVLLSNIP